MHTKRDDIMVVSTGEFKGGPNVMITGPSTEREREKNIWKERLQKERSQWTEKKQEQHYEDTVDDDNMMMRMLLMMILCWIKHTFTCSISSFASSPRINSLSSL